MQIGEGIEKIVLIVEGGIGKNVMATAVVRAIKKQHPNKKLVVVAGCSEVFFNNPNVKRVYNFGNPLHFYEDNVEPSTVLFKVEPYLHPDYIARKKHLVECWCEMIDIKFDGSKPDLYMTPNEIDAAEKRKEEICKGKELLLIQWSGGKFPDDTTETKHREAMAVMYRRSLKKTEIQKIVDLLKEKYHIGIIGHTNFPEIVGTDKIFHPIRNTIALLRVTDKFIGIDSFAQHTLAAFNKSGLIFWGGTSPVCLGYDVHNNIFKEACPQPFCHRPNSYLLDIQPNGAMWDCPYGETCLSYSAENIIELFK